MSHLELLPCRWRRPSPIRGRQGCTSSIVHAGQWGVMDHQCWMCPERDHLDPAAVAPRDEQAGDVRHLLYHVYPVGDRWRWHMEQLRRYASLWNGRRIVSIAVGPGTASIDDVHRELIDFDADLRVVGNDPQIREMASYPRLIEELSAYVSPADCHFYGHAKGVVSEAWGPAARRWAAAMYEALLGHWPAVRRELTAASCVGIFRRLWEGPLKTRAKWHYSGAFRWVRNADFYARDWRGIDQNWLGSETHIGRVFGKGESACLYGEFGTQDCGLYAESEWQRWAEPQRIAWLSAHAGDRWEPRLVTVILTAHRQAELVHQAIASVRAQTTPDWQLLIVDSGELGVAGHYDRYRFDGRVSVMHTGETASHPVGVGRQAWAINEAWRRHRVRGDLVVHLSDDDLLAPTWLARVLSEAAAHPDRSAWYGRAQRQSLHAGGLVQQLGWLNGGGVGGPGRPLRGRIDGMQVAHRRSVRTDWPEDPAVRHEADGHWMDALAAVAEVWPVDDVVGVHRHTPLSTFTRSAGVSV